jgi:C-terminal processing protease CtpA/Prc
MTWLSFLQGLQLRFVATDRGLEVTGVEPAGPAARLGLQVGDVIVSVNGDPATSAEAWRLRDREGGPVWLSIWDTQTGTLRSRTLPGPWETAKGGGPWGSAGCCHPCPCATG